MAVAQALHVMASHLIQRQEPSREAGAAWCARLPPQAPARRLITRLAPLGSHVPLQRPSTDAVPEQGLFSRQAP